MTSEKACVEFQNFSPTHAVVDIAQELQERVFDESPSDSAAKTVLKKVEEGFEGEMKIVSKSGTFLSHINGHDPINVLSEMSRSVRQQIRGWRNTRWANLKQVTLSSGRPIAPL